MFQLSLKRARFTSWPFRPFTLPKSQTQFIISPLILAVYHLRGNHTVTMYEVRGKRRYHLCVWSLGFHRLPLAAIAVLLVIF